LRIDGITGAHNNEQRGACRPETAEGGRRQPSAVPTLCLIVDASVQMALRSSARRMLTTTLALVLLCVLAIALFLWDQAAIDTSWTEYRPAE
jgi:hypothetical protein